MLEQIDHILLMPESPIEAAIRAIDQGGVGIALVVDDKRKLLGIVTDVDIRKSLLKRIASSAPVSTIMCVTPVVGLQGMDAQSLLELMEQKSLRQLPVVDAAGVVVGVERLSEAAVRKHRTTPIVLMVGGRGTRLRPLTDRIPKPMLPIAGRPCLEILIEHLASFGFENFHFILNYQGDVIRQHFQDGSRFKVRIDYVEETSPLGTAGGLRLLKDKLKEPFLVLNGDLLTRLNMHELAHFFELSYASATMAVREHDVQIPYGVIQMDDTMLASIDEKPIIKAFVNAGIYMLHPDILDLIPAQGAFQMNALFDKVKRAGHLTNCFLVREFWMDIGNMDEYRLANTEYEKWIKQPL